MPFTWFLPLSKLVVVVGNPVMLVAVKQKTVIRFPSISEDVAPFKHMAFDDGQKLFSRAIADNPCEHLITSFDYPKYWNLISSSSATLSPDSFWAKIALVQLHLSDKRRFVQQARMRLRNFI